MDNTRTGGQWMARGGWGVRLGLAIAATLLIGAVTKAAAQDKKGDGAGIVISKSAGAKDVGLPIYPGAKLHKEENNDPAANLGLWGSNFGFKLAVLKMESGDAAEKLAAFYRKALGKYGKVLDCSNGSGSASEDSKSKELTCDSEKPEKGGMLFKAGTKQKQHIVGIQANDKGSLFQLVYVEARNDEKDAL